MITWTQALIEVDYVFDAVVQIAIRGRNRQEAVMRGVGWLLIRVICCLAGCLALVTVGANWMLPSVIHGSIDAQPRDLIVETMMSIGLLGYSALLLLPPRVIARRYWALAVLASLTMMYWMAYFFRGHMRGQLPSAGEVVVLVLPAGLAALLVMRRRQAGGVDRKGRGDLRGARECSPS